MMLHKRTISLTLLASMLVPAASLQAAATSKMVKNNPKDQAWHYLKGAAFIAGAIAAYKASNKLMENADQEQIASLALAGGIATYGVGELLEVPELKEWGTDIGLAGAAMVSLKTKPFIRFHNAINSDSKKGIKQMFTDATDKEARSHSTFAVQSMALTSIYKMLLILGKRAWAVYRS